MSLATFVGIGVSLRVRDSVKTSTTCRQEFYTSKFEVKSAYRPTGNKKLKNSISSLLPKIIYAVISHSAVQYT